MAGSWIADARPRSRDERCAFCHDHLDGAVLRCEGCGVLLHESCRGELADCPTIGCGTKASSATAPVALPVLGDFPIRVPAVAHPRRLMLWPALALLVLVPVIVSSQVQAFSRSSPRPDWFPAWIDALPAIMISPLIAYFAVRLIVGWLHLGDAVALANRPRVRAIRELRSESIEDGEGGRTLREYVDLRFTNGQVLTISKHYMIPPWVFSPGPVDVSCAGAGERAFVVDPEGRAGLVPGWAVSLRARAASQDA